MRLPTTSPSLATLRFAPLPLLFATFTLLGAGPAHAQDPFAEQKPAPGTTAPVPEGVKGETHESLARPKVAEPEEPPPIGPVERLPPTAYPEWKTRGLYGGSLWMTFHGMPWPYYPKTGIGVSGYAWLDTGYEQIDRGTTALTEPHEVKYLLQQGRGVVRVTPTFSLADWYVQGQAELVANKDQTVSQANGTVDVDDLWVRTGYWKTWDVTVGRFEGFEVYHFGMGLDVNTLERLGATDDVRSPPGVHGFTYGFLRPPNLGNVALHCYLGNSLRTELLGQVGNEAGLDTVGVRPAAIFDMGFLKLKAAGQVLKAWAIANTSQESKLAYGATAAVQVVLDPYLEAGVNFDWGYIDHYNANAVTLPDGSSSNYDRAGSVTTTSFGGFANARVTRDMLVGVGANYVTEDDALPDATTGTFGHFTHLQGFGAIQYLVGKQLFIKVVGGYARAHFAQSNSSAGSPTTPWDNSMVSGRVRFLYLF